MKKLLTLGVLSLSVFTLFSCTQKEELKESEYTFESYKTMIPETCKSFFDGCNNCNRTENNAEAACTLMYCEKYQKPKCLGK